MAVTTYAELKTAINDWLDRSDLTAYTGDFIAFAEGALNRAVIHRKMVTTTDLTPSSNVCTLPTDYMNYLRVVEKASVRRELKFITPSAADQQYPSRPSGLANNFIIIGDSLTALPLSSNDIELTYKQKIPALSDANTSNWLLDTLPQLYLEASKLEALIFINETSTPRYASTSALTQRLIDMLNDESILSQFYSAGLQMRNHTP